MSSPFDKAQIKSTNPFEKAVKKPLTMEEASQKYGSITKTPGTVEKVVKNLTSQKTRPVGVLGPGGVVLSAMGIPEEEAYPLAGQAVGSLVSGFPGAGFVGSTGGATAGQYGRQLVKEKLRGQKADMGEVGREALVTGAIEGATRGTGNLVFRRQIAKQTLDQLSGKLAQMKEALIKQPHLTVDSWDVYQPLKEAYEKVAAPFGEQKAVIEKWLKVLEKNPKLDARNLIEMEQDLGQVAKYGEMEKGAFVQPSNIKKPALNKLAKTSRSQVSDIVDKLATQGGQPEFAKTSKKVSKLLQNPAKTDVTKTTGGFGTNLLAALSAGGAAYGHNPALAPAVAIPTYLALKGLQSPTVRNLAFKGIQSAPAQIVGKTAKLTLSELARRYTGSKK